MFIKSFRFGALALILGGGIVGPPVGEGRIVLSFAAPTLAGEFNEVMSIGDTAPALESLVGLDGKVFDPALIPKDSVTIIAFTCNTCPYANDYEARIIELANHYKKAKQPVLIIAINSNDIAGDSLEAMNERANKFEYPFSYWKDQGQEVAKQFGASKTPEYFVLSRTRQIVYMGAFDDNTDAAKVKVSYVQQAVDETLANKKITLSETPPVGCRIRAKRERR